MGISIQMLGTGFAFSKKFYNTSALIRSKGYTLLIDCGYTTPKSLHDLDLQPNDIDGIFISHLHADHIGGLEEFAFRMKYSYLFDKKPTLFIPSTLRTPLWENCLKGGLGITNDKLDELDFYFEVVELEVGVRKEIYPALWLETFATQHIPGKDSYGLLIDDLLLYSADACFNQPLLEQMFNQRRCRYIMHDCQLTEPGIVHATLRDLLNLSEEMQKITYLMHYGDEMEEFIGKTGFMRFVNQHEIIHFS